MLEGFTPWPAELAARYRERGYWRDEPLGDIVDRGADRFGQREALTNGTERITYMELKRRVDRLALHLLDLGLGPRDRVVVQLHNTPEFVFLYFACTKIGALPIMALLPHRLMEISYLAGFSEATAYAGPTRLRGFDYQQLARQVRSTTPTLRLILAAGDNADPDMISLTELLGDGIEEREPAATLAQFRPDASEVALFLLSGGTTGLPKLIPRTHNDYEYNSRASGAACDIGPDTVYMAVLPVAHNFALASPGLQSVLQVGGRVCSPTRRTPQTRFSSSSRSA